jgi:hypothetical protein
MSIRGQQPATKKSKDDAIEDAIRDSRAGDVLVIHEDTCIIHRTSKCVCDCVPVTLQFGASA